MFDLYNSSNKLISWLLTLKWFKKCGKKIL
jgi:hypothetical protein